MNRPSTSSTIVSVDLGDLAEHARNRVAAGEYDSLDSFLRAAVVALDDADGADPELAEWMTRRLGGERGADIPASEAFARIDDHIRRRRQERDAA